MFNKRKKYTNKKQTNKQTNMQSLRGIFPKPRKLKMSLLFICVCMFEFMHMSIWFALRALLHCCCVDSYANKYHTFISLWLNASTETNDTNKQTNN